MKNSKDLAHYKNVQCYLILDRVPDTYHITHTVGINMFYALELHKDGRISGYTIEQYSNPLVKANHWRILTKKRKVKGVEVEFVDSDVVQFPSTLSDSQLVTFDEAKLELIKYIANDFESPEYYDEDREG